MNSSFEKNHNEISINFNNGETNILRSFPVKGKICTQRIPLQMRILGMYMLQSLKVPGPA